MDDSNFWVGVTIEASGLLYNWVNIRLGPRVMNSRLSYSSDIFDDSIKTLIPMSIDFRFSEIQVPLDIKVSLPLKTKLQPYLLLGISWREIIYYKILKFEMVNNQTPQSQIPIEFAIYGKSYRWWTHFEYMVGLGTEYRINQSSFSLFGEANFIFTKWMYFQYTPLNQSNFVMDNLIFNGRFLKLNIGIIKTL